MAALQALREQAGKPLEEACSLPFSAYTNEEVFAAETAGVFHNEWVFACMDGELPKVGDYFALSIAGEPVLILRAETGLRAYSNTCRHRGTQLLDNGFGQIDRSISCPYHAWTYDLEGALTAVPFDNASFVDQGAHRLARFAVDTWHGLVFVHLGDAPYPLGDRLEGIDDYIAAFEPWTFDSISSGETEHWQTNWKLAMENAMESYHLFKVHRDTLEKVSPTRGAYYLAGCPEWSLTGGTTTRDGSSDSVEDHYLLISLPPSFVGVFSGKSLGWLSAHPAGVGNSVIRSGALGVEGWVSGENAFTKAFFAEDKWICERVMRGMASSRSRGGKLVEMERVVVDFHHFLADRLFGDATPLFYENDEAVAMWQNGA